MTKTRHGSQGRSSAKGLFGGLASQLEAKVAPFLARQMPERYYEIYCESLIASTEQIPVLEGLPAVSMAQGYIPLRLSNPRETGTSYRAWDALTQSSRLLVLGDVGAGKSTFLQSLAWRFAGQIEPADVQFLTFRLFGQAVEDLKPILVDLYRFARGNRSLFESTLDSLAEHGFPGAENYIKQCLSAGQCVILLDGLEALDDSFSANGDLRHKQAQIGELVATYPKSLWIITARPTRNLPIPNDFAILQLDGFDEEEQSHCVQHYLGDQREGLLAACERNPGLAPLAANPLTMAAMCRVVQRKTRSPRLPELYDACLELLLSEWGVAKGHPRRYQIGDQLNVLQQLAFEMLQRGESALEEDEILALIRERLADAKQGYAAGLLETFTYRSGVLCPTALPQKEREVPVRYRFALAPLQNYLAAQWIVATRQAQAQLAHVDDPAWQDALILTAALLEDPLPYLYAIESQSQEEAGKWLLLARCIAECATCEEALVERIQDHLYELLKGEAEEFWRPAAVALAGIRRMRTRTFFPDLVFDKTRPAEQRRRAALVLGRLGEEWAIPALGAAISDEDPSIRQQAAWALGHIPSAQAVRVLPRALRSVHQGVREAAAIALAKQGKSPELTERVVAQLIDALDAEREENPEVARLAEEALIEVGPAATPQLLAALNNRRTSPSQRSRVARTLGRLGDQRALPSLIDAILHGQAAPAGEPSEIEGYIEAVACVGADAVPALIRALEGKDISTSTGLVAALARIGAPAIPPLIEAIAGNSPEIRNAAVRALEQVGTPAIEPLTQALLTDNRFEVRRRALEILGHIGEKHVVAALIHALDDSDIGVRINAVQHLGRLRVSADTSRSEAVPKLVEILQAKGAESQAVAGRAAADSVTELTLRRAASTPVGALGDPAAIPALLDVLAEPDLNAAVATALVQFGEQAVEPLIVALHDPKTRPETRRAAWDVVDTLGARARPEEENFWGLASVYSALRQARGEDLERPRARIAGEGLSDEEILELTAHIAWWKHGNEIHRSLGTAHDLAGTQGLKAIGGCRAYFDWMSDPAYQTPWLRPQVQEVLWGFRDVVESINVFQTLTRRDSQRNTLMSAIDRIEQVRHLIGPDGPGGILPFEQQILAHVVSHWHETILETVSQLRGRASLLINLLTPIVPLRKSEMVGTVVFQIFNEGDSAARNFWVSLRSTDRRAGVEVVNGERVNLNPLGIGEERQVEIAVAPHRAEHAALTFEATYDDDERQGVTHRYGFEIRFVEVPDTYIPIERSPYIVGMPVKTSEMFFGRQDIFEWVRENVSGKFQEQALLLYGERRMGKTSVLYQLLNNPPTPQHICLLFDLQLYGYIDTVNELLFELASAIQMRLAEEGIKCEMPEWEAYGDHPQRAFTDFCRNLDERLGERRLLIMLDEFGVLIAKVRDRVLEPSVFDYIRGITQRSQKFTFLFTGAYEVRRMQQDFNSILFNMPKVRKISYLTEGEVNDLILKPVEGILTYHPMVVPRIQRVTAGHPYFTQYICDELVLLARKQRTNYIRLTDLEFVIRNVLEDAAGNIENSIYNYLDDTEKLVLAALANVTDDVRIYVPLGDIMRLLESKHLTVSREEVIKALQALKERDLVSEMRIGQQLRYSFRMGLTRMWLRENDILLRWIQERET